MPPSMAKSAKLADLAGRGGTGNQLTVGRNTITSTTS